MLRAIAAFVVTRMRAANTHAVGIIGLVVGAVTIGGSGIALYNLLTDPQYLVDLYGAILRGRQHIETQADILTFAKLVAACIALFVGISGGLISAYLGRPATIPASPPKEQS